MTQQPPNIPQARARIEGMKRQFEQKRQIEESLSGIKNKIGVYSGKGGVGKTTVAISIAAAFPLAWTKRNTTILTINTVTIAVKIRCIRRVCMWISQGESASESSL